MARIPQPLLFFRMGDRPLRLSQVLALLFLIPYAALLILGQYRLMFPLFGISTIITGILYTRSRGFPFSRVSPKWTGLSMVTLGFGMLVDSSIWLLPSSHLAGLGFVTLGIGYLFFLAGIAALVMSFRRPLRG